MNQSHSHAPKGRKAIKQAIQQINLQTLAQEHPEITKAFATIALVVKGMGGKEVETDILLRGDQYHFKITQVKQSSGIVNGEGEVIA